MTITPEAPGRTRWTDGRRDVDGRCPTGPIADRWDQHRFDMKLVNPSNRRRHHVIIVGSGLAGSSAAATLGEAGYHVSCFCFQDSPRRAHSIAAQGGINAAKNYRNDGDSVYRLFYDTVKGGDYRSRESNVYRLAQVSVNIIDQFGACTNIGECAAACPKEIPMDDISRLNGDLIRAARRRRTKPKR